MISVDMNFESIREILIGWAENQPLVKKLYLFGSRYKGTHREDSDVDVAIEIIPASKSESEFVTWMNEAGNFRRTLQPLLPYKLDLQWYGGEGDTDKIHKYLSDASVLIYEKMTK